MDIRQPETFFAWNCFSVYNALLANDQFVYAAGKFGDFQLRIFITCIYEDYAFNLEKITLKKYTSISFFGISQFLFIFQA